MRISGFGAQDSEKSFVPVVDFVRDALRASCCFSPCTPFQRLLRRQKANFPKILCVMMKTNNLNASHDGHNSEGFRERGDTTAVCGNRGFD